MAGSRDQLVVALRALRRCERRALRARHLARGGMLLPAVAAVAVGREVVAWLGLGLGLGLGLRSGLGLGLGLGLGIELGLGLGFGLGLGLG